MPIINRVVRIPDDATTPPLGVDPKPEQIPQKPLHSVDLGEDALPDLPPKAVLHSDIKKLMPKFASKRKALKIEHAKREFIIEFHKVLTLFDSEGEDKYDHQIVLLACQCAEDFFLDRQMGEVKQEVVIESVLPFFKQDKDLVLKIIELVLPLIQRSTFFSRNKQRLINFFWSVVDLCVRR